jgi:hypothetical protein
MQFCVQSDRGDSTTVSRAPRSQGLEHRVVEGTLFVAPGMAHDDGGSGGGSAPSARDEAPLPQRRGGRRRQRQAALGAAAAGGSGAEAGASAAAAGDGGDGGEEFDGRERRRARLGGVGDMMAGAIACAPPPLGADAAAADVMFDRSVVSVQYECE